ncbi:retron St85 family effector protein [Ferrovum sp.]|uniref:retron St85 family effector protein n=1 Tax=Ferrovum sp. TaxID=2609467 RepID=UPI002631D61D|nr:retron St85 family effector protein [Ferrovum sp.]
MEQPLQDPRPTLLSAIDIEACKIELSNKPIVLLCGGPVRIKERPDDPTPAIVSLRHAVTEANTSYEIFRPEEIESWLSDGIFRNLMNLEADLASICSLVVIILESAGSLAELGAFSQLPDLSEKIIAIRSNDFRDAPSFINLGILRHLTENEISSVKNYPWDVEEPTTISTEVVKDVVIDIQECLDHLPKSSKLKLTNSSHVVVLICEIIELFSALKENEIYDYLVQVGVAITKDKLKRKLFLLKEFRLIKNEVYGDATFFIRTKEQYHRLRMALKEGSNKDALRISAECLEYYNADPKQRHRKRAISQARQGVRK